MDTVTTFSVIRLVDLIPSIIIFGIGIAFSFYSRSTNPRKFLLPTISFSLLLISKVSGYVFSDWAFSQFQETEYSATLYANRLLFFGLIDSVVWIVAWTLLFFTIFNQKHYQVDATSNKQDG